MSIKIGRTNFLEAVETESGGGGLYHGGKPVALGVIGGDEIKSISNETILYVRMSCILVE